MVQPGMQILAGIGTADLPCEVLRGLLLALERNDAVTAAVRGQAMAAYDAQGSPVGDGQRTTKAWVIYTSRVTRGQATEHLAVQKLAEQHRPPRAALAEGGVLTKSVAIQLALQTRKYRDQAEEILVAAARAGPTCGRWPRSARRSPPAWPRPTPTAPNRAWTSAYRWMSRWTGPGSGGPPPRSAPGTAAPGWTARPPSGSRATR
jgi:hypothetical protein